MKKLILIATAILGTAAASQAGVHFDFGVNVPLPGELILGHRAPARVAYPAPAPVISQGPVVYQPAPEPVYAPAPEQVYAPAPASVCSVPAQTVYCPPPAPVCAPQVVIAPRAYCPPPRHGFYAWGHDNHWRGRGWDRHDDHRDWHRR